MSLAAKLNEKISHNTKHINGNKYINDIISNKPLNSEFKSYLLFGAINFHQSDVKITNTKFYSVFSEDALNLINSNFYLENVEFENFHISYGFYIKF